MNAQSAPLTERKYYLPFVLVTSLFFLWAIGVNLNDVLIPHLKKAFELTDFESSFIQVAFFGGYFLAAFPAGWLMEKIGYKGGIVVGLLMVVSWFEERLLSPRSLIVYTARSRHVGADTVELFVAKQSEQLLRNRRF